MSQTDADALDALRERAVQRVRAASPEAASLLDEAAARAVLEDVAIASDFAIAVLARQPEWLPHLLRGAAEIPVPVLASDQRGEWGTLLRRYRLAASTRLVWRDVAGFDSVADTLTGSTALAEHCLQTGLAALETEFAQRHGVVRDADGRVQRLVVFGLGKLGGGELNFSSDVDLVYAYEHAGESDGLRPLVAEDYFARLGQQLARLLD